MFPVLVLVAVLVGLVYAENGNGGPGSPGADVVWLEGGEFVMGNSLDTKIKPFELAAQRVKVDAFGIDAWAVTNAEYRAFVRATRYKSESEIFGWSFVLDSDATDQALAESQSQVNGATHWLAVAGAYWRAPHGPKSGIGELLEYPATHLSYNDGVAYCKWRGMRLPTESEWEFAARGGRKETCYPWGNSKPPLKQGESSSEATIWPFNIWQGDFPKSNDLLDTFKFTAPSKHFLPNDLGIYNVLGNVWEWTSSKWVDKTPPPGQNQPGQQEQEQEQIVLRGGSFLDSVEGEFNHMVDLNARMGNTPDSASSNTGVRCAKSAEGMPKQPKKSSGYKYPEPPKPKGIAGLDQEMLQKIAAEGGVEALQEFLGDRATVTTPGKLKEQQEQLRKKMEELGEHAAAGHEDDDSADPSEQIEL